MSPMMILYLYAKNQKILPIEYWENPQKLHFWAIFSPNLPKKIFFSKVGSVNLNRLWFDLFLKKIRENKWVNVEKSSWSDFGLDILGILAPVTLLAITFVPHDEKIDSTPHSKADKIIFPTVHRNLTILFKKL